MGFQPRPISLKSLLLIYYSFVIDFNEFVMCNTALISYSGRPTAPSLIISAEAARLKVSGVREAYIFSITESKKVVKPVQNVDLQEFVCSH